MPKEQKPKQTREERADELFRKGVIVTRTADGYSVPGSNGNVYEITEMEDGCLWCTCPDALYRSHAGELCKHSLLALKVKEFLPTLEAPVIDHDIHLHKKNMVVVC